MKLKNCVIYVLLSVFISLLLKMAKHKHDVTKIWQVFPNVYIFHWSNEIEALRWNGTKSRRIKRYPRITSLVILAQTLIKLNINRTDVVQDTRTHVWYVTVVDHIHTVFVNRPVFVYINSQLIYRSFYSYFILYKCFIFW